jgi:hypothetical protein
MVKCCLIVCVKLKSYQTAYFSLQLIESVLIETLFKVVTMLIVLIGDVLYGGIIGLSIFPFLFFFFFFFFSHTRFFVCYVNWAVLCSQELLSFLLSMRISLHRKGEMDTAR